jgi:galactose mutarotase-like enzyme
MSYRTPHEWTAAIEANRQAAAVPTDEVVLTAGQARLAVRKRGAFITDLTLQGYGDQAVDVLYAEADHTKAKLVASHGMMPVGPSEGVGGQHGFLRWADYEITYLNNSERDFGFVTLEADTAGSRLRVARNYALSAAQLLLTTIVENNGAAPLRTSLGEHLYFALPEGAGVEDIRIDQTPIDELLYSGATEKIKDGKAQFWPDYSGKISVYMPDDRVLNIENTLGPSTQADERYLGMLLWQRPGKPYVCLEPTLGFLPFGDMPFNELLEVPAYSASPSPSGNTTFTTTITAC